MYSYVGDLCISWIISTVPLTQMRNTIFLTKLFVQGIKKLLMKPENYFGHNVYNTTKNDGNPVVQLFRKANDKDFVAMIYKLILKYWSAAAVRQSCLPTIYGGGLGWADWCAI